MPNPDSDLVWRSAEAALIAGDVAALDRLLREHEAMFRDRQPPSFGSGGLRPDYSGGDAQSILLRNHLFENWAQFAEYSEARRDTNNDKDNDNSTIARFEAAVDAIVGGDAASLEALLRNNPELIRARSTRKHRAALLHYVGSNGVEYFRQKTPRNIVTIAQILLSAGAEIDATADIYGGSTTFGLAATSIHPVLAGVLIPLLETLLQAGAAIDGPAGAPAILGCLSNGRPQAAEFLAAHGARLDLEAVAGVGRLDVVRTYFNADGILKPGTTQTQMLDGFTWACEYGRTVVVDFLLKMGIEVGARGRPHQQTGLHWAAYSGHLDVVKLLLEWKAPVGVKDETFQGTPLEWAIHGWANAPVETTGGHYYEIVALLVAAGADVDPQWLADPGRGSPLAEKVRADPRMLAALRKSENS